jgi:hypothetical protein
MIDLPAARTFVRTHGRLLERRRLDHIAGDGSGDAVLAALAAYRNADGGFGGLEPDVRTDSSQPTAALYALEVLDEIGDVADTALATGALDWLQTITNDDGGVPFVLSTARDAPYAPWYAPEDDPPSSLLATAAIVALAHRLGLDHPWLGPATDFCWQRIPDVPPDQGYTFRAALDFLDAVSDRSRAEALLDALADRIPDDGAIPVAQGVEGEVLRVTEIAPAPGHAARRLFPADLVDRELDDLERAQRDDGGWTFTWLAWSPAAAFEWRGIVTVHAIRTLRDNGRLDVAGVTGRSQGPATTPLPSKG